LRKIISDTFFEVLKQTDCSLQVPELTDELLLLESGLDSLGFAILVAALEEKLNYDPFTMMDEPVYPKTFAEFINIYERFKP